MSNAEEIAAKLGEAYREDWETGRKSVGTFFAATVDERHQPPLPQDGLKPGAEVAEQSLAEFGAYKTMLSDFREETTIRVDGDTIVCDVVLAGTTADGTDVRAPVTQILTVQDGAITKSEVVLTPEVLTQLAAIVRAGGKTVDIE
jgi:ketosteroid isomerase-like protein